MKLFKVQTPFQPHHPLPVEMAQLATFPSCISHSTTFSKTQREHTMGIFIDLSWDQQMGHVDIYTNQSSTWQSSPTWNKINALWAPKKHPLK